MEENILAPPSMEQMFKTLQDNLERDVAAIKTLFLGELSKVKNAVDENVNVLQELTNQVIMNEGEVERLTDIVQQQVDNNVSNKATRANSLNDRRSSFFPAYLDENSDEEKKVQRGSANVVITERIIDPSMQMKGDINVRAICWLTQTHAEFNAGQPTGCKDKPLINFVGVKVKESLILKDQQKKVPNSGLLNTRSILKISDVELYHMFARYIRPNSMEKFKISFLEGVKVKFVGISSSDEFTFDEYHSKFHAAIDAGLTKCEEVDSYFRLGATEKELSLMPSENWGKSEAPGVFRIIMEAVGKFYAQEFTQLLSVDKINACKNVSEFCAFFKAKNHEWSEKSEENSALKEQAQKPRKLKDVREKLEQQKILAKATAHNTPDSKVRLLSRPAYEKEAAAVDEAIRSMGALNVIRTSERLALAKTPGGTRNLACHAEAFEGACLKGRDCVFSHDELVLKEFLRTQNFKVRSAPLWEPSLERLSTQPQRKSSGIHPLGNTFQMMQELEDEIACEEHEKETAAYCVRNHR